MLSKLSVGFLLAAIPVIAADSLTLNWPQFRGPGGSGVGDERAALPIEFGPNKNVVWKTRLPSGHGSPCIWGNRVFITSFDSEKKLLEVIAIDRKDGTIVWRKGVEAPQIEKVHDENNPASSTPVTDGELVYVYFGSFGLIAYDFSGKVAWQHPMPVYGGPFGSGTSPVLVGNVVLISLDYPPDPALIAVNKKDGTLGLESAACESPYRILRVSLDTSDLERPNRAEPAYASFRSQPAGRQ